MLKRVLIPAKDNHKGIEGIWIDLDWKCIKCGGKRGDVKQGYSFDGEYKLYCDRWINPCGHTDKYAQLREEARTNGLNKGVL